MLLKNDQVLFLVAKHMENYAKIMDLILNQTFLHNFFLLVTLRNMELVHLLIPTHLKYRLISNLKFCLIANSEH